MSYHLTCSHRQSTSILHTIMSIHHVVSISIFYSFYQCYMMDRLYARKSSKPVSLSCPFPRPQCDRDRDRASKKSQRIWNNAFLLFHRVVSCRVVSFFLHLSLFHRPSAFTLCLFPCHAPPQAKSHCRRLPRTFSCVSFRFLCLPSAQHSHLVLPLFHVRPPCIYIMLMCNCYIRWPAGWWLLLPIVANKKWCAYSHFFNDRSHFCSFQMATTDTQSVNNCSTNACCSLCLPLFLHSRFLSTFNSVWPPLSFSFLDS